MTNQIHPPVRRDGLQLEEHRHFQRNFWRLERIAWFAFGLILVIAICGFAGAGGIFSDEHIKSGENDILFPRVTRWQTSGEIVVRLAPSDAGERTVFFAKSLSDRFQIEGTQPLPKSVELVSGGLKYHFSTPDKSGGDVIFNIRPQHVGIARTEIATDDNPKVPFLLVTLP